MPEQDGALPIRSDSPRPLAAYRVLELPGAPQLPLGRAFADLGAEVIKVEPPGGDPARQLPPTGCTVDGSSIGLYWASYSLGKRSLTVDLGSPGGRDRILELAAGTDVVIESSPPGLLDAAGLGYANLSAVNPGLVLTSLSSFGQTGPYASWRGSDLVHFAMSGYLHMTGPKDERPIKPSVPYQTWLFGSLQALSGTLLALRQRKRTGRGAHVDQSLRETGLWMLTHTYQFYDMLGINLQRHGARRDIGGAVRLPYVYPCLDGYVVWLFQAGDSRARYTQALVEWMAEAGLAPAWLLEQDWFSFDLLTAGPEMENRLAETFGAFFATRRKAELFEWAIAKGAMLGPVQNLADLLTDPQLVYRQAWRSLDLGLAGGPVRVPAPPIRFSDAAWEPRGGPPGVGESNEAAAQGPGFHR